MLEWAGSYLILSSKLAHLGDYQTRRSNRPSQAGSAKEQSRASELREPTTYSYHLASRSPDPRLNRLARSSATTTTLRPIRRDPSTRPNHTTEHKAAVSAPATRSTLSPTRRPRRPQR